MRIILIGMANIAAANFETAIRQAHGQSLQPFNLRIENGELVGNLKVIRVGRGDHVEISWSADRPTVVHLHGYDIEAKVYAEKPQVMSFTARMTGRFPLEQHNGRHRVLLYVEVHPR